MGNTLSLLTTLSIISEVLLFSYYVKANCRKAAFVFTLFIEWHEADKCGVRYMLLLPWWTLIEIKQKKCVDNMFRKSPELGCRVAEISCLCKKDNFMYGIRDCSREACGQRVIEEVMKWYYASLCGE
jgi:CFEM domain